MLGWICLAELAGFSPWFSATAALPRMPIDWATAATPAWLSMAVTLGFVAGTTASAATTLADVLGARRLFALSALAAALANAVLLVRPEHPEVVLASRFVTGVALAGVYPPAMKLAASWFVEARGLAVAALVGAQTLGAAVPHLLDYAGGLDWRVVVAGTSIAPAAAALLALGVLRDGPHLAPRARFDPRQTAALVRDPAVRLVTLGYFGHMWELYAMWTWIGTYVAEAFTRAGLAGGPGLAALATAAVFGAGGAGCLAAGLLGDRIGRTATTILAMASSGACALAVGALFDRPAFLVPLVLLWGLAVVADSAQFSAALSELAPRGYVGTALSLQTASGFLLAVVSIRVVPEAASAWGWPWAFALLAPGPFLGSLAMWRLRRRPESLALAGGRR